MTKKRKILTVLGVLLIAGLSFIYGTTDVAIKSIPFDLRKIGESVYEAHSKTGQWPAAISDLAGTEYLNMPYRREALEKELFVVVWQQDLDVNPQANKLRVLAYDNGSMFSRLGWVWACRGDLTIERIGADEVRQLKVNSALKRERR